MPSLMKLATGAVLTGIGLWTLRVNPPVSGALMLAGLTVAIQGFADNVYLGNIAGSSGLESAIIPTSEFRRRTATQRGFMTYAEYIAYKNKK